MKLLDLEATYLGILALGFERNLLFTNPRISYFHIAWLLCFYISYVIKTLVRLRVSISHLNFPIKIFYQNKSALVSQSTELSSEQKVPNILKAIIDVEEILDSISCRKVWSLL